MWKNKVCGIYLIINNLNGMLYVGQSTHCKHRWSVHKSPSSNTQPIDLAINNFGAENFTFKIERECLPEDLDFYERETIEKYHTLWPNGYNMNEGGRSEFDICEESRRKMGRIMQGKNNPFYNHKHTEETRRKQSESAKNRPPFTEEQRRKMSESAKNRPPVSNETKKKLSELYKGIPKTEEVKRKISETKKNTPKPKWLTPNGEIREMITTNAQRWHPDWVLIEKDL